MESARRLIDSEGIGAVSMIRLSKELGTSSMTLYNYVRNADEVLREILIQTISGFYDRVLTILGEMDRAEYGGMEAYAIAYAAALFDLAEEQREICRFLVGDGYLKYYNDAELRRFYHPLGPFLLGRIGAEELRAWEEAFRLYRCVVFFQIQEQTVGSARVTREEYLHTVRSFVKKMFPPASSDPKVF